MTLRIIPKAALLLLALTTVFMGILTLTAIYKGNRPSKQLPETVQENENQREPLAQPFLIVPNGYPLTQSDIDLISTNGIRTIFIHNGLSDYIQQLGSQLPGLIVHNITNNSEYIFCNNEPLSMEHESASILPNKSFFLSKNDCDEAKKISNIFLAECNISDSACQNEYLITIQSNSYYYNATAPLLALAKPLDLTIDYPYGTYILTWNSNNSNPLTQASYSYEILDKLGTRLAASGRISTSQPGDFFSPLSAIQPQRLTAKVRIWYQFGSVKFKQPLILTTDFDYQPPDTSPTPPSPNTVQWMSWIPSWGMASGIESVKKYTNKWSTISPVWFTPNKDGTLKPEPTLNSPTLLTVLKQKNIKLVPTISLFDADILTDILHNHLDAHVNAIVDVTVRNNYTGIDLDYESTYAADKDLFLEFLAKLSIKLHEKGKILVFTALPKIDDREIYSFLPQTHQAQDWKAIGAIVDEFRIMAYDFTGQGSTQPGPLSPISWNESLIRYAIAQMPAEKVVLALPLYAHAWSKPNSRNLPGINNDQPLSTNQQKNTVSPQHNDIAYLKEHSSYYREKYDPVVKEIRAEYLYNKTERIMYYLNNTAIHERAALAQRYGIKGLCFWRIGGEDL